MRIQAECLHCLLRQVTDAVVMTGADDKTKHDIMKKELEILSDYESYASPPHIAGPMHNCVRAMSGCRDPYYNIKEEDMATAKANFPLVEEYIATKDDPLYWGIKAACAGNTLDSAANPGGSFKESMAAELDTPYGICDIELLREKLKTAKRVLILADNSGETYFDVLMLRALGDVEIIYAVRDCPSINDATVEIAERSGIAEYARIISSGSTAPGTILSEASNEFKAAFETADVVISKGQGNYEALDDANREIFYLFKVKCPVISSHFKVEMGKYVLKMK
ncbi:MAG: DUF89 family protein [Clostridia bacterium]|nr:DUF89 family protein [Clostridia bacterium]